MDWRCLAQFSGWVFLTGHTSRFLGELLELEVLCPAASLVKKAFELSTPGVSSRSKLGSRFRGCGGVLGDTEPRSWELTGWLEPEGVVSLKPPGMSGLGTLSADTSASARAGLGGMPSSLQGPTGLSSLKCAANTFTVLFIRSWSCKPSQGSYIIVYILKPRLRSALSSLFPCIS